MPFGIFPVFQVKPHPACTFSNNWVACHVPSNCQEAIHFSKRKCGLCRVAKRPDFMHKYIPRQYHRLLNKRRKRDDKAWSFAKATLLGARLFGCKAVHKDKIQNACCAVGWTTQGTVPMNSLFSVMGDADLLKIVFQPVSYWFSEFLFSTAAQGNGS